MVVVCGQVNGKHINLVGQRRGRRACLLWTPLVRFDKEAPACHTERAHRRCPRRTTAKHEYHKTSPNFDHLPGLYSRDTTPSEDVVILVRGVGPITIAVLGFTTHSHRTYGTHIPATKHDSTTGFGHRSRTRGIAL